MAEQWQATRAPEAAPLAIVRSPGLPSRPALDPWAAQPALEVPLGRAPLLTAGFAVGWLFSVAVLGTFTAVWAVGMIATTVLLVLGQGGMGPVLVFAFAGVLLARGWVGMAQTMRSRLRLRDLAEPPPLPDAFWALSAELQRVVRHARSLQIVLDDPQAPLVDLDREMFEWIGTISQLPAADLGWLAARGLVPDVLREELVFSRWSADRRSAPSTARLRWRGPDHRARALEMLAHFEQQVLHVGGDPFRGGVSRRS